MDFQKRRLLRLLAAASITHPLSSLGQTQTTFTENPFQLGVASGCPKTNSIVLWTRLHSQHPSDLAHLNKSHMIQWQIAKDKSFREIIQQGVHQALPELGNSIHAEPIGLTPNTEYFYRFKLGTHVSDIGRTKTLPKASDSLNRLTVAYVSCQHYEHGYFSAYQEMIKDNPDVVLFLGDYIYEYPQGKAENRARQFSNGWLLTLNDYRERYTQYKLDKDLQDIHAHCPWIFTWDDHEVQNDYAGIHPGKAGPQVDNFLLRRTHAYQAYYENMPLSKDSLIAGIEGLLRGAELRLYQSYAFGDLAHLIVLDGRQYRSRQVCNPHNDFGSTLLQANNCPELEEDNRSFLGQDQEIWLEKQLSRSGTHAWQILGQETLLMPRIFPRKNHELIWTDGWDGYPKARQRLINTMLKRNDPNIIIFSGDVHENYAGYIKENFNVANSKTVAMEFCGTALTTRDFLVKDPVSRMKRNSHMVYAELYKKGYGLATFSKHELIVTLKVSLDATQQYSGMETLARFRVKRNSSQLELMS